MTLYIGPILFDSHTNPTVQWGAEATARGMRSCSIGGFASWDQGKQLQELVDNPARLHTVGDASGVLERIWPDDAKLAEFRGRYLLHRCDVSPSYGDEEADNPVPFSLTATRLPDHMQDAVARSARVRANAYSLTPTATVAQPLAGGSFVTSPGGIKFTRQYDPLPHDSARQLAPSAEMDLYAGSPVDLATVIAVATEAA